MAEVFRRGLVVTDVRFKVISVVADEPISIGSETTQPLADNHQQVFECTYFPWLWSEDLRTAEKIKPWVSAD